jgi:hypothetical protein
MNEYIENALRDELEKAVESRYGDWLKELKTAGVEVQKYVSFTAEKDGKHTGEAKFSMGQQCFAALYEYIPGSNLPHWYMVRDWKD